MSGSAAQPRRLAILALLAAAGEQGLTREKVLGYLWPEMDEERARKGLNQGLYALRQDLGSDDVFLGTRDLRLNRELVATDVGDFQQALAEGKLEQATAQYVGPFLDGFHLPGAPEFERWVEEERAGLARSYAEALDLLARRAEARGGWSEAIGWCRKLAAQDPLNARVAMSLMRALAAAGDRSGALQHARVYEVLMEQELEAPPDREVVALAEELRRGAAAEPAAAPLRERPITLAAAPPEPEPPPSPTLTPAVSPVTTPPVSVPTSRPHASPVTLRQALAALVLVVAGLGSGLLLRPSGPVRLVPGSTRRVAFDQALELDPALSPDGKMVAYTAEAGDRFQIFVRQVDGGHAVPVSEALPGSHWRPQWLPDGSQIAFQSGRTIYAVPPLGGVPRPLVQPPGPASWVAYPTWSPDGKMIAYVENWVIKVRPTGGGPPKPVAARPPAHSLAWSPDGRWIAFVSGNPVFGSGESPWGSSINLGNIAPSSIWVVPAQGGAPVQVMDAQSLNTSPVWLPGTRDLLFVSDREGSRDIYRVSLEASGRPAGEPARLTTGLSAHSFSISPKADELAYSVFTNTGNIWAAEIPRRGPVSATEARPFTEGTQVIEGMALSPNGRWLAFDSDRSGNQEIYKIALDGGEPVQLTSSPEDEFVSSWSGDGREIALHSYHRGVRRVRLLSADGGQPRDIGGSPPNQRSPGFSPDGGQLVFTSDASGRLELYMVSREQGSSWSAPVQLTRSGGWAGRWAPDGHAIAYCREDGVWLVSPRGGPPAQVVSLGSSADAPAPELALWGPDSRTIYYKAFDATGRSTLWSVAAAGGPPRLLVRFDEASWPSSRPEFATDGKRLFFTIGTRQSDIWAMELRTGR